MSEPKMIHRLGKLDGEETKRMCFMIIGGDRWSGLVSKRLMPGFDGKWSVDMCLIEIIDETHSFDYVDEINHSITISVLN